MSLTCDQACWGDGPYPDLAEFGDVVWVVPLDAGDWLYLSGGAYGLLNSYLLTDPAPLVRNNTRTPGNPGAHPRIAHVEQRIVDLSIRVSGRVGGWTGTPNTDAVVGVEENIDILRSRTIEYGSNLLGGAASGFGLIVTRKSGETRGGLVQCEDFTADPGRESRTVNMSVTIPAGGLPVLDP